jgi:hypothetical protein
MDMNALVGDAPEDPQILFSGMGNVLAKRRNDVHIAVWSERLIKSFGYLAGAAMCSRKVRRQQKHSAKFFPDSPSSFIEEPER